MLSLTLITYTRTVVRECYKDDGKSMEKPKNLTPRHAKTPEPIDPIICRGDYVPDISLGAKFCSDRTRFFFLPIWVKYNSSWFGYYFVCFWVLPLAHSRGPHTDLHAKKSKDAVPRRDVHFGGFERKI